MNIIDKIEEITGRKFEDLNYEERDVVRGWMSAISQKDPTIDSLREFVANWKVTVENQLANDELSQKKDMFLKARLKNLLAIEGFLQGPEKAKKALEAYLGTLEKK